MPTFTAALRHHSHGRGPQITVDGTLLAAKRAATREFGDGFIEHRIVILDEDGRTVSKRELCNRRWIDNDHAYKYRARH